MRTTERSDERILTPARFKRLLVYGLTMAVGTLMMALPPTSMCSASIQRWWATPIPTTGSKSEMVKDLEVGDKTHRG